MELQSNVKGYDSSPEQVITESGAEKAAGLKMLQEVLGSDLRDWQRKPGGQERADASTNSIFEKNWQSDSGGKLVQLDMVTGKLLTRDERGEKVDYQSHSDSQRMSGKNSLALSSFFMLSPLAMLGMGTTFAFMNQAEQVSQNKEVNRLTEKLSGNNKPQESARPPEARVKAGYSMEMVLSSYLLNSSEKRARSDAALDSRLEREKQKAFEKWIKEADMTIKEKRKNREKTGDLSRKRSRRRSTRPMDMKSLVEGKQAIENRIEKAHEDGLSLAESSRLHSQLEALDRAIIRLSQLS